MVSGYAELNDHQWQKIKPFVDDGYKRKLNLRAVTNAIFYVLRTGVQWRNLPSDFPKWQSVYYYFRKWKNNGSIEKMNTALNIAERQRQGAEPSPSILSIDSQSVKKGFFVSEETGIDGGKKNQRS